MTADKIKIQILPSLLAADMGNLLNGALTAEMAGGDSLHVDIMDGHFVPNISMGPAVVASLKHNIKIPLCVHLMLTNPGKYIGRFIESGSNPLFIHIESNVTYCLFFLKSISTMLLQESQLTPILMQKQYSLFLKSLTKSSVCRYIQAMVDRHLFMKFCLK